MYGQVHLEMTHDEPLGASEGERLRLSITHLMKGVIPSTLASISVRTSLNLRVSGTSRDCRVGRFLVT